ncbi:TolB family protein [Pedobacter glucosidilyticus]|uniref:TolB family protein n=1 Tax=Pedobacter glucosidilyticus TaxID=1122941 RepID=UPI000425FA50|nr:DPP IV N-terminal domain-containing protein [Pedobacter glucosidilyticus]
MKNKHLIIVFLLVGITTLSCKKNKNSNAEEPCPGFCKDFDFGLIDYQPEWSPDGKYIAYYHIDKEITKNGIWLITPDGKENRLWHSGVGAETPTWSPDGQWIAFSQGAQIWKKKLNGDSLTRITNEGRNFFPAWSPDGKWIAYDNTDCGNSAFPAPANSCGILLTNFLEKKLIVSGRIPSWINSYSFIYIGLFYNIYKYNLKDFSKVQLTTTNTKDKFTTVYSLKYSTKNYIALTSQVNGDVPQIWIMNDDGSNLKQLTQTGGYTSDWSPDGSKIVFTDSRAVNGRLWLMNADGSDKQQLSFENKFNL